jgi:hypothetical protein
MTASILTHAQPTCEEGGAASIESSMRPHCLNAVACAAKSKATHCRRCWGLRLNSMGRSSENEAYRRDRAAESLGPRSAKRWNDPEYRERMRKLARERGTLQTPEAIARRDDPEVIRRREESRHAGVMALSPDERRRKYGGNKGFRGKLGGADLELYDMLRAKNIPAAECLRMIEEDARAKVRRAAAEQQARSDREKAQAY